MLFSLWRSVMVRAREFIVAIGTRAVGEMNGLRSYFRVLLVVSISAIVFLLVFLRQVNQDPSDEFITYDNTERVTERPDSSETPIPPQSESSSSIPPATQLQVLTEPPNFLPPLVLDRIKSFVFFVGHARSGHSIVGAILDSHPHIVISHEEDLFNKLVDEYKNYNKSQIFNTLWHNSYTSARDGLRTHTDVAKKKGYTLAIDGLYQGTYQFYIDVIGDKRGGLTADMMAKNFNIWKSVFLKLKSTISLPMKVVRVIRNPYDNIATIVLMNCRGSIGIQIKDIKESNKTFSCNLPDLVDSEINNYFQLFKGIEDAKAKHNLDIIEIHGQDLIANPKKVISEMCSFLQVTCDDNFLTVCSEKIFPTESKTRHKFKWKNEHISKIKENINRFSNLHRYDFNS